MTPYIVRISGLYHLCLVLSRENPIKCLPGLCIGSQYQPGEQYLDIGQNWNKIYPPLEKEHKSSRRYQVRLAVRL